ncbi:restriction endonuclease subunit S [Kordia sp.]|uniref:restriction endonuclease subunit S n=1 Tax=Kordia sp. TaxID=1965332 RepID=UPI003D277025
MNTILKTISYKNLSNWSVAHLLANDFDYNEEFPLVRIGNFLTRNKTRIEIEDETVYKRVTIRLYNKGVKLRNTEIGKNIGTKKQFLIKKGHFLLSKIDARNGAFGIATDEVDGAIITADFFAYDIDETKIDPLFLVLITTTEQFQKFAQSASSGTTGRQRIDETKFLDVKIPLPTIERQLKILEKYRNEIELSKEIKNKIHSSSKNQEQELFKNLGLTFIKNNRKNKILDFVSFKNLQTWGVNKLLLEQDFFKSEYYKLEPLKKFCQLIRGVTYKKSSETNGEGYKVLRANNINLDNTLNLEDIKTISFNEQFSDEKRLKQDDIFICLASGSKKHIGKVAYIEKNTNYFFGGFMGAIRIQSSELLPEFLNIVLNSSIFNEYLSSKIFGSNINNLNSELLYSFKIPVPSLEIQNEIISTFSDYKSSLIKLKEDYSLSRDRAIQEFIKEIFNEAN